MPRFTRKPRAVEPLTHLTQASHPDGQLASALLPSAVLGVSVFDDLQPLVDDALQSLETADGTDAAGPAGAAEAEETVGTEGTVEAEAVGVLDQGEHAMEEVASAELPIHDSAHPGEDDDSSSEDFDVNEISERLAKGSPA